MTRPLALLAVFAAVGPLSAADFLLLSGKTVKGTLVAVDAQFVSVKEGETVTKIPVKEMSSADLGSKVAALPPGTKYDEIELTDGSILRLTEFKLKAKAVEVAPVAVGTVPPPALEIGMTSVFFWCRNADDLATRESWKKVVAARKKRDMLVVLAKGEHAVLAEGTILGGNDAGTGFDFQGQDDAKVTYLLTRASGGLIFNQEPQAVVPPMVCKVADVFGNVLYAQAVTVDTNGLTVKTVAGVTAKYKSLEAVAKLDFSQGNVAYLSELEAVVTAPPSPPDEPVVPFMKDKVLGGTPLRLEGKVYAKGLWVYPETTLTYKLGGDYREFKAVIGIDDEGRESNANSGAKLTIVADGRVLLDQTFTRKDKPKEWILNLKDVKELKITVDRDSLFTGSHLDLCEVRVQK